MFRATSFWPISCQHSFYYNETDYEIFFIDEIITLDHAKTFCEDKNLQLATIFNENEFNELKDLINYGRRMSCRKFKTDYVIRYQQGSNCDKCYSIGYKVDFPNEINCESLDVNYGILCEPKRNNF